MMRENCIIIKGLILGFSHIPLNSSVVFPANNLKVTGAGNQFKKCLDSGLRRNDLIRDFA